MCVLRLRLDISNLYIAQPISFLCSCAPSLLFQMCERDSFEALKFIMLDLQFRTIFTPDMSHMQVRRPLLHAEGNLMMMCGRRLSSRVYLNAGSWGIHVVEECFDVLLLNFNCCTKNWFWSSEYTLFSECKWLVQYWRFQLLIITKCWSAPEFCNFFYRHTFWQDHIPKKVVLECFLLLFRVRIFRKKMNSTKNGNVSDQIDMWLWCSSLTSGNQTNDSF